MRQNRVNEIASLIKEKIKNYDSKVHNSEIGKIVSVGDGIALVSGLDSVQEGEILDFGYDVFGLALNLEEEFVGVAILGNDSVLKEDMEVTRTKKIISVKVGEELSGRVVDALGRPIDGKKSIQSTKTRDVFITAPGVMTRQSVDQPLETGIMAIDSMIPIGRGQRELIIGDRQTGKTAIAIDTILNQKGKGIKCIYVAIGQKNSTVSQIVKKLEDNDALEYTTIVVAGASELAPMQYIAPYTGVTIAEEFMQKGIDSLIIYDDLSKHAVAYRTLSLLLRRPPGREAYPGDVFYLHSRLLERSARLNKEYGGGSITALPIVETQQGDISAYIPTNVISITDGQIFTKEALFNSGQRPAIDVGFSVSRVGSTAQHKMIKQVAASLKLELAQYNEMQAFSQFGSDLDQSTKSILDHGQKVYNIIKQNQYSPVDQVDQVLVFLAVKLKVTNIIPAESIETFKKRIISHFSSNKDALILRNELQETKNISPELEKKLKQMLIKIANQVVSEIPGYDSKNFQSIPGVNQVQDEKNKTQKDNVILSKDKEKTSNNKSSSGK
ncbi:F-type H+-transporting ATPase subunit alpha [Mycoplasma testudineum]|uniref:ATP synthase subunit alpha n=1 Tax=Mycoplasma testudineum TaxID=244584 RepID=A0A4R6IHS8_9MOLU|nr:F0F1 ATP synthase subunit alpha [Mycoplasma testudineum]OYD27131.1 F0F1 ATP synthase subunit alpha [Mycoplasma testudineum]TDO21115.1 F-type H+-transporting ATPase subunit alpha [Mycoplasma testudineum]